MPSGPEISKIHRVFNPSLSELHFKPVPLGNNHPRTRTFSLLNLSFDGYNYTTNSEPHPIKH